MVGNNTVQLCEAAMIEALQHYFDTVTFREGQAPQVTGIRFHVNEHQFEVKTKPREQKPAEVDGWIRGGSAGLLPDPKQRVVIWLTGNHVITGRITGVSINGDGVNEKVYPMEGLLAWMPLP